MELCALSSGSRGNATLIKDGEDALIIDIYKFKGYTKNDFS